MVRKWVSFLGALRSILDKALLKQSSRRNSFDGTMEKESINQFAGRVEQHFT